MTKEQLAYFKQIHETLQLIIRVMAAEPQSRMYWLEKLEHLSVAAINAGIQE